MYASSPAIYSFVPSIGSINQKIFALFFLVKSTDFPEIGIFGVKLKFCTNSLIRCLGELSSLIYFKKSN